MSPERVDETVAVDCLELLVELWRVFQGSSYLHEVVMWAFEVVHALYMLH